MSYKQQKKQNENRQRNSYIIGIGVGVLFGAIFGYATDSILLSTVICALLGFGLGHAIYITIK